MKHYYQDRKGIICKCKGSQIIPSDRSTYIVWTLCGKDVPANKSFRAHPLKITCEICSKKDNNED